jgi:rRNA-processing protein FCF1
MKTILIDTNALIAVVEWKIDLAEELKKAYDFPFWIAVVEGTREELSRMAREGQGKEKRLARLALALLQAKQIPSRPGRGNVDKILIEYSKKGYLVLTQDRELKKKLLKPYLTIRQKRRILVRS